MRPQASLQNLSIRKKCSIFFLFVYTRLFSSSKNAKHFFPKRALKKLDLIMIFQISLYPTEVKVGKTG